MLIAGRTGAVEGTLTFWRVAVGKGEKPDEDKAAEPRLMALSAASRSSADKQPCNWGLKLEDPPSKTPPKGPEEMLRQVNDEAWARLSDFVKVIYLRQR